MKYFNNNFLIKLLREYEHIDVYVNQEYLTVHDPQDIVDNDTGIGYNSYGKPVKFNYKDIELIKVGSTTLDIENLNSEEKPEKSDDIKVNNKKPKEDGPPKKDDVKKEESLLRGDRVELLDDYNGFKKGIVEGVDGDLVNVKIYNPNLLNYFTCIVERKNIIRRN